MSPTQRQARWAVLLAFALTFAAAGCIDDLPEPTGSGDTCSLDGVTVDATCLGNSITSCETTSAAACYRQDASCDCTNECATSSCPGPVEACPEEVTALGGTCLELPSQVNVSSCAPCGCVDCMRICDGRGTAFASPGSTVFASWNLSSVGDNLRLGAYVRARGRLTGVSLGGSGGPQAFDVTTPGLAATVFRTYVLEDLVPQTSGGASLSLGANTNGETLFEIDCIVPFTQSR